jgi:hypothetical protein
MKLTREQILERRARRKEERKRRRAEQQRRLAERQASPHLAVRGICAERSPIPRRGRSCAQEATLAREGRQGGHVPRSAYTNTRQGWVDIDELLITALPPGTVPFGEQLCLP